MVQGSFQLPQGGAAELRALLRRSGSPERNGDVRQLVASAAAELVGPDQRSRCEQLLLDAVEGSTDAAYELCRMLLPDSGPIDVSTAEGKTWTTEIYFDHVLHDGAGASAALAVLDALAGVLSTLQDDKPN